MKKQLWMVAMCLAGLFALPAYAQTATVKVRVPFGFGLGDKAYPAGEYAFSATKDHVVLEREDHARIAMALANHVAGHKPGKTGQVMFECYDEQCFVSTVWLPGQDDGYQLLRSRTEALVAARGTGKYMALLGKSPQR